jgi:hypothetical protein
VWEGWPLSAAVRVEINGLLGLCGLLYVSQSTTTARGPVIKSKSVETKNSVKSENARNYLLNLRFGILFENFGLDSFRPWKPGEEQPPGGWPTSQRGTDEIVLLNCVTPTYVLEFIKVIVMFHYKKMIVITCVCVLD